MPGDKNYEQLCKGVGANLRELRERSGLKVETIVSALPEELRLKSRQYMRYEAGQVLTLPALYAIGNFHGVTVRDLFTIDAPIEDVVKVSIGKKFVNQTEDEKIEEELIDALKTISFPNKLALLRFALAFKHANNVLIDQLLERYVP